MAIKDNMVSLAGHVREAYWSGGEQEALDTKNPNAACLVAVPYVNALLEIISKVGPCAGLPFGRHKKTLTREEPVLSDTRPQWQQLGLKLQLSSSSHTKMHGLGTALAPFPLCSS